MNLGHFSYLVYTLIFTLLPIIILWVKEFNFLIKNVKIIFLTIGVSFFYTLIASTFAQLWGTWHYSSNMILGIYIINFPIEDLIFAILVSIAISSGVLVFIYYKQTNKFRKIYEKLRGNV